MPIPFRHCAAVFDHIQLLVVRLPNTEYGGTAAGEGRSADGPGAAATAALRQISETIR